jgi:hypothetical protein
MATNYGTPPIVQDGLVFYIDPANPKNKNITSIPSLIGNVTGTLSSQGVWQDSYSGYWNFDGTGDKITLPNSDSSGTTTTAFAFGDNNYTMHCWWKYIGDQVMWASGRTGNDNFYISITSTFLGLGSQSVYKHRYYRSNNDSTWFHWALVREGQGSNQSKWYINGELASNGTDATTWISAGTEAAIAGYSSSPAEGEMGPFAIYNGNYLTAEQIKSFYDRTKERFE